MYNVFVAWRESRARSATLSAIVLKRVLRLLRIGVCVVLALAVRPAMSAEPETAASLGTPPAVTPEPNGTQKPRFISFVVPPSGTLTALRVTLVTLNRPRFCCTDATAASCSNTRCDNNVQCISAPNLVCAHGSAPGGAPNYDCFEGETRFVNSFTFPEVGGSRPDASAPLTVRTGHWGDLTGAAFSPPDGKSDVLDVPAVVNYLKTVEPIFSEPRSWLKQHHPAPHTDAITVLDLSDVVDGGPQGKPYPASRVIDSCPHD